MFVSTSSREGDSFGHLDRASSKPAEFSKNGREAAGKDFSSGSFGTVREKIVAFRHTFLIAILTNP
jgi:hypothetical protein